MEGICIYGISRVGRGRYPCFRRGCWRQLRSGSRCWGAVFVREVGIVWWWRRWSWLICLALYLYLIIIFFNRVFDSYWSSSINKSSIRIRCFLVIFWVWISHSEPRIQFFLRSFRPVLIIRIILYIKNFVKLIIWKNFFEFLDPTLRWFLYGKIILFPLNVLK